MRSSIKAKKRNLNQWRWFVGLYVISLIGYGVIEVGLHYLNTALVRL